MNAAIEEMRVIMTACGGITDDQVNRYAEEFTRGVIRAYFRDLGSDISTAYLVIHNDKPRAVFTVRQNADTFAKNLRSTTKHTVSVEEIEFHPI